MVQLKRVTRKHQGNKMNQEIKAIKAAIDYINQKEAEKFLEDNAEFLYSNIDGVYHYKSKTLNVDKFIFFDFGKTKELSLVIQEKEITLNEIVENFNVKSSHYDFREDISKIDLDNKSYIVVEGKVDVSTFPIKSVNARGNVLQADKILVSSIVIELD